MADYCGSCNDLKILQPDIKAVGMTTAICNSLKNDTGLNPSVTPRHTNCDDMSLLSDCMIGGVIQDMNKYNPCDYKEALTDALTNLKLVVDALNCSNCGIWSRIHAIEDRLDAIEEQIRLIWIEIDNIYTLLDALRGTGYERLAESRFSARFYNNWYTESGTVRLDYIETPYEVYVRGLSPVGTERLQNDDILSNVRQRHEKTLAQEPQSAIYGVNFTGASSAWNNYEFTNVSEVSNGIWNLNTNASPRPPIRWHAGCQYNTGYDGNKITANITQYADGFNSQFSNLINYYSNGSSLDCTGSGINLQIECLLRAPSTRKLINGEVKSASILDIKEMGEEKAAEYFMSNAKRVQELLKEFDEERAQLVEEKAELITLNEIL